MAACLKITAGEQTPVWSIVELQGDMIQPASGEKVTVTLVPLGNADKLRRVTFPIYP